MHLYQRTEFAWGVFVVVVVVDVVAVVVVVVVVCRVTAVLTCQLSF